jgi:hypothetical protein
MPFVNPVIVIGLALPVAVYLSTLDWQVTWYCTEAAAAEFVGVNVIATLRSLALALRIKTAPGGAALETGSVVVPQARVETLRKNAGSSDGFMGTSHATCAQTRFTKLSMGPEQRNNTSRRKISIFHARALYLAFRLRRAISLRKMT